MFQGFSMYFLKNVVHFLSYLIPTVRISCLTKQHTSYLSLYSCLDTVCSIQAAVQVFNLGKTGTLNISVLILFALLQVHTEGSLLIKNDCSFIYVFLQSSWTVLLLKSLHNHFDWSGMFCKQLNLLLVTSELNKGFYYTQSVAIPVRKRLT